MDPGGSSVVNRPSFSKILISDTRGDEIATYLRARRPDLICRVRTADIYLLMALGRPDVWPDGDLALATAAHQVKRLRRRPDTERLRRLAADWAPWRAVAARILWHHYLSTRGG